MKFIYNDGGRQAAGYKGHTGDCVVRAIAIVTEKPYQEVYDELNALALTERKTKRMRGNSNARTGVYKKTMNKYILSLGYKWQPTMFIGQGCKVHLKEDELPMGRLIVSISRHIVAVVDRVIHDTYNPCRNDKRCVYGYYYK